MNVEWRSAHFQLHRLAGNTVKWLADAGINRAGWRVRRRGAVDMDVELRRRHIRENEIAVAVGDGVGLGERIDSDGHAGDRLLGKRIADISKNIGVGYSCERQR